MIELERTGERWYTEGMARPPISREKKTEKVTAKVPPSVKEELQQISAQEDRSESYLTLAFIVRGIAAYRRDGKLTEVEATKQATMVVPFEKESPDPSVKHRRKTK